MEIGQRPKPIGPTNLRERLSELYKNGIVIGPKTMTVFVAVISPLVGWYLGGLSAKDIEYKRNLISQLLPKIEKLDNKPGLSLEDLEKAGLPTHYFTEGIEINLARIPISELEKALEEYQSN